MAITNAQQFKQLVNPPMEGKKRPGYRGDAAYGEKDEKGQTKDSFAAGDGFDRESFQTAQKMGEARKIAKNLAEDKAEELVERFRNKRFRGSNLPGFIGMGLNLAGPLVQRGMTANRNFFLDKVLPSKNFKDIDFESLTPSQQDALYGDYMSARLSGDIDAFGNKLNQGDDSSSPLFPPTGIMAQVPSDMDQEPEIKIDDVDDTDGRFRRFRAEGGIMNSDVVGGEYDFESARQMYGFGKLVKKIGRTVKKIAKSPIGKAALIGVAGFGIPGTSFGGLLGRASFGGAAKGLFGTYGPVSALKNLGIMKSVTDAGAAATRVGPLANLGVGSLIVGASALAGLLTPAQEEEAQLLADNTNIDIDAARNAILARAQGNVAGDPRARAFRAEGGPSEGKEPVAKKTMPLLDMDGKEMDLRDEGGFVPIGRMEKADDVPARLSKNEFVFTADAVRNAGDGDVDKGAEVMYNMMKNLEAGGDVSEESQGLEGARKMFQTSQRLEEVL